MWLSVVCTLVDNDTRHYRGQNVVQQIELHHQARALLQLLITSAAYTHGQIVDAELANQSARFALAMLKYKIAGGIVHKIRREIKDNNIRSDCSR